MNDFNMYPKGYNMVLGNISTLSKFAKFHDSDKDFIPKVEYNANEFVLNTNRIVAFYDVRNCEEIKDMKTRYGMRTKIVLDNGEVLYVADNIRICSANGRYGRNIFFGRGRISFKME